MRAAERIEPVIDLMRDKKIRDSFISSHVVPSGQMTIFDDIDYMSEEVEKNLDNVLKIWKEEPDLRFGQLLINECILPDNMSLWLVEETSWIARVFPQHAASVLFWGTYGKTGDEPLHRIAIADMSRGHMEAVLKIKTLHPLYREVMLKRLNDD